MIHAMIFCDVLLILGVSGCIFLPFVKLFTNKRVIVNVDGLEWRRAKWNGMIKKFLLFSEWMAVQFADRIITDNAALQDYAMEEYGIESSLIEYGADHVKVNPTIIDTSEFPFLINDYAFKVCRIEPENNIHTVLEAFQKTPQIPLIIVGNWKDSEYGKSLLEQYEKINHFYLLDPIYDQHILNQLRSNCLVYIHGHSAGGTNPSLVEAMYLGLPIIAFDVVYNKVTTEYSGEYFSNATTLIEKVLSLSTLDLSTLGTTMQAIAERRYTWSIIATKYESVVLERKFTPVPSPTIVY